MMKKLTMAICVLMLLALSTAYAGEMRGLWVDSWNPGFKTPAQTTEMIAKAKDCKFNALFVQVRKRGDVYYKSKIEPMARDAAADYDPLADIVEKAHAAKMQVHAWVVMYEVYHDTQWTKPYPDQVHLKHPEWLMKNQQGGTKLPGDKVYLDPGVPEARAYLAGLLKEIVDNYDVDGVQLDVVRYPGREFGYNDTAVARFNAEKARTGTPLPDDEAWCSWRRDQVTAFMRLAEKAVHSRKKVALSASVFANRTDARDYRFQDWEAWLDQGLLDFAVPMVFQQDDGGYQSVAASAVNAGKGKPIVIGQGGWRLPSSKSLNQISYAVSKGAKGVVVYSYAGCCIPQEKDTTSLMDALKTGPYSKDDEAPSFAPQ